MILLVTPSEGDTYVTKQQQSAEARKTTRTTPKSTTKTWKKKSKSMENQTLALFRPPPRARARGNDSSETKGVLYKLYLDVITAVYWYYFCSALACAYTARRAFDSSGGIDRAAPGPATNDREGGVPQGRLVNDRNPCSTTTPRIPSTPPLNV